VGLFNNFKQQKGEKFNSECFKINFDINRKSIEEYQMMLSNIYGLQFINKHEYTPKFTFGIIVEEDQYDFYAVCPEEYSNIIKEQHKIIHPHIRYSSFNDPLKQFENYLSNGKMHYISGYRLMLNDNTDKSIQTPNKSRFLLNIISNMMDDKYNDKSIFEITFKPINNNNNINNNKILNTLDTTVKGLSYAMDFFFNSNLSDPYKNKEKTKIKDNKKDNSNKFTAKFNVDIKIICKSKSKQRSLDKVKSVSASFSNLNKNSKFNAIKLKHDDIINRQYNHKNILTVEEISQFMHLPHDIGEENYTRLYDDRVPSKGIVYGDSNGKDVAFPMEKISPENYSKKYKEIEKYIDDFSKPLVITGRQGNGKSEWIVNLAIAVAKCGISVIIVDPKVDTQKRFIESLPKSEMDRLDYLNYGDLRHPPAMNLFRQRKDNDPIENSLITSSFIALMKKHSRHWGFKMQRMLQRACEAVLLNQTSTLNELDLLLNDPLFREHIIEVMEGKLNDNDQKNKAHIRKLLRYWKKFHNDDQKDIDKKIEPAMNVIGPFIDNQIIKTIVGQEECYDFREAADNGRITIVNIPEGSLEENTKILSSIINKRIWLDMQSRADSELKDRYPTFWVMDEAHEILDEEFTGILTKARAYRLGVALITQGLTNFRSRGMDNMKDLIETNCQKKITFNISSSESRQLAEEFAPLTLKDLSNCPKYHFYAKTFLKSGEISDPFFVHAPLPANKERDYNKFIENHKKGRKTMEEIEIEIEERMDHIRTMNKLKQ
jgi:hypothetical protein